MNYVTTTVLLRPRAKWLLTTLLVSSIMVVLSACGLRQTTEVAPDQQTQPTRFPTLTLSAQEATNEGLRATNMARVANDIATSEAMPTPEVWPTLPPNPTYDPNRDPRGFVLCEPAPSDKVLIENCWAEELNGVRIGVRAGVVKTDPEQGALQIRDKVYLTPTRSGRARMVQADGLILTVRTADGSFFGFNVATLQWRAPQPTATPRPVGDYPSGIMLCENPPTYFLPGNCWASIIDNHYYQVRAGAARPDPMQGYLVVVRENLEAGGVSAEFEYLTPVKAGRVEVIQATGTLLTLRAEDGRFFAFDLTTRQWVTPPAIVTSVPMVVELSASQFNAR